MQFGMSHQPLADGLQLHLSAGVFARAAPQQQPLSRLFGGGPAFVCLLLRGHLRGHRRLYDRQLRSGHVRTAYVRSGSGPAGHTGIDPTFAAVA
jgi:hypothetical protein